MCSRAAGRARRNLGACCSPSFILTFDELPGVWTFWSGAARSDLTFQGESHKQRHRSSAAQARQKEKIGRFGELQSFRSFPAPQRQISADRRNKITDANKGEKVVGERGDFLKPRIDFVAESRAVISELNGRR
jgi:hypothetical protein